METRVRSCSSSSGIVAYNIRDTTAPTAHKGSLSPLLSSGSGLVLYIAVLAKPAHELRSRNGEPAANKTGWSWYYSGEILATLIDVGKIPPIYTTNSLFKL